MSDPVTEAREALEEAMHFTFLQDGEQECREEIQRALSALSKLHTERRWPCGCVQQTAGDVAFYVQQCDQHPWDSDRQVYTPTVRYLVYDSEPTTGAQE